MADDNTLVLLLPERRRFGAVALSAPAARTLGRADRLAAGEPGERAQLARHFRLEPAGLWPMAAISRQADVGDAAGARWLRADPVHLRADLGGARLLAWGNLGITPAERDECLAALAPMFAEAGVELSAPMSERWYLRLPAELELPEFASPEQSLGDDVFRHLPSGPDGRRWRAWLNEAQVAMHHLPFNAARAAIGQVTANSLWFWGGGAMPDAVASDAASVGSDEADVRGLAVMSGAACDRDAAGRRIVDLRHVRDWRVVESAWLGAAGSSAWAGRAALELDFADGARWRLAPRQRWRLWRGRTTRLDA